jgi:hypothetical protein
MTYPAHNLKGATIAGTDESLNRENENENLRRAMANIVGGSLSEPWIAVVLRQCVTPPILASKKRKTSCSTSDTPADPG